MKKIFLLLFSILSFMSYSQDYNFESSVVLIGVDSEEELLRYVSHPDGCKAAYVIKPLSKENKYEYGFRVLYSDSYAVKSVNSKEVIPFSNFYKYFMELSEKTSRVLFQGVSNQELIFVKKEGDEFVFYPATPYYWTI